MKATPFFLSLIIFILEGNSPALSQQETKVLSVAARAKTSPAVFEGKVLRKISFWDNSHTGIYTANIIEIYKVFGGNILTETVEIVTPGGTVGTESESASEGPELKPGDTGMFFCEYSRMLNAAADSLRYSYVLSLSPQGFIKYDLAGKAASDAFKKYTQVEKEIYSPIRKVTGQPYKSIKKFSLAE